MDSVFDLLGTQENDLTAAFGFGLSRSTELLRAVMARAMPGVDSPDQATVSLEVRDVAGRTDLEIAHADGLIVVEAKKGWLLPTTEQLSRYAPRIIAHGGGALVTVSEASNDLAAVTLPREVDGVPVLHVPWREAINDIRTAQARARGRERLWLGELRTYLQGATSMVTVPTAGSTAS